MTSCKSMIGRKRGSCEERKREECSMQGFPGLELHPWRGLGPPSTLSSSKVGERNSLETLPSWHMTQASVLISSLGCRLPCRASFSKFTRLNCHAVPTTTSSQTQVLLGPLLPLGCYFQLFIYLWLSGLLLLCAGFLVAVVATEAAVHRLHCGILLLQSTCPR